MAWIYSRTVAPCYVIDFTVGWSFGEPQPSKKADLGTWEQPHARALRVVCLGRLRASKGEVTVFVYIKWNSFESGSLAEG